MTQSGYKFLTLYPVTEHTYLDKHVIKLLLFVVFEVNLVVFEVNLVMENSIYM